MRVDLSWRQQAGLAVVPEHPGRYLAQARELADSQHDASIDMGSRRVKVKTPAPEGAESRAPRQSQTARSDERTGFAIGASELAARADAAHPASLSVVESSTLFLRSRWCMAIPGTSPGAAAGRRSGPHRDGSDAEFLLSDDPPERPQPPDCGQRPARLHRRDDQRGPRDRHRRDLAASRRRPRRDCRLSDPPHLREQPTCACNPAGSGF
jgi:hypothetical protein